MHCTIITFAADRFADPVYTSDRSRLRFAVSGATALAGAFLSAVGDARRIDVQNEAVSKTSVRDIFGSLATQWDGPERTLVVVLSGHGDDDGTHQWFCTFEAKPGVPDLGGAELADMIAAAQPTHVVVIMDFCHAGGVAADAARALEAVLKPEAVLVLAGTTAHQLAFEHPAIGLGLFTYSLQDALTDRRFYVLAADRSLGNAADAAPQSSLARLFVFAREETEELAYLYASGRRQSAQLCGSGDLLLTWSAGAVGPPVAPESRRALAARLRSTAGWTSVVAALIAVFLYCQMYHISVSPDGWLEVRPGPAWMASLAPRIGSDQLAVSAGDLSQPNSGWDRGRIQRRASLMDGVISGFSNHVVDGKVGWERIIEPELSPEAADRFSFVIGDGDLNALCSATNPKRDASHDYEIAVEAALLDRARACKSRYFLSGAPDLSGFINVTNLGTHLDFSVSNLSDQAVRVYLRGLAIAYRELRDGRERERALTDAVLLVSSRSSKGSPRDSDWSAFMAFLDEIATAPGLPPRPDGALLSDLTRCAKSWCAVGARLAAYFAQGPTARRRGDGAGMMGWLFFHDQANPADRSTLPSLLLLARTGALVSSDFDLLIRYFHWVVPDAESVFIDSAWLPRFARAIALPQTWKAGLMRCAFGQPNRGYTCSTFEAQQAADVLAAQVAFLGDDDRKRLVQRFDAAMKDESIIPKFGRQITDLACAADVPQRWIGALETALDYQVRIAAPHASDPLTGVTIIEIDDDSTARALAAAAQAGRAGIESRMLLARYAGNHWNYTGLDIIGRALRRSFQSAKDSIAQERAMLVRLRDDVQSRVSIVQAVTAGTSGGTLRHALFDSTGPIWRVDAGLAAHRSAATYQYDVEGYCPGSSRGT